MPSSLQMMISRRLMMVRRRSLLTMALIRRKTAERPTMLTFEYEVSSSEGKASLASGKARSGF